MDQPLQKFNFRLLCLGFLVLTSMVLSGSAKPSKDVKGVNTEKKAKKDAEFPEEDSDMLMEPNNFEPITVLRSHERSFHPILPPSPFQPLISSTHQLPRQRIAQRMDDSNSQAAQNYYPPFFREAPPLGHSRPYFPTPEVSAVSKYAVPLPKLDPVTGSPRTLDSALLGSGDFGVIRGGTFYPEEEMPYHPDENSDFGDFYADANNGHGRPAQEDFIEKFTYPEEQFANFRDFADINTPADGSFSQFVVVYAAKNATNNSSSDSAQRRPQTQSQQPLRASPPRNIFEQLEQLDREKALEAKKTQLSTTKLKLAKTKLEKKYKKDSSPKDMDYEPLLALS